MTVLVNDQNGDAKRPPAPLAGDRAAQWVRWLHEGSHSGVVWKIIVFATGILPAIFGITGVMMWLRGSVTAKFYATERSSSMPLALPASCRRQSDARRRRVFDENFQK